MPMFGQLESLMTEDSDIEEFFMTYVWIEKNFKPKLSARFLKVNYSGIFWQSDSQLYMTYSRQ